MNLLDEGVDRYDSIRMNSDIARCSQLERVGRILEGQAALDFLLGSLGIWAAWEHSLARGSSTGKKRNRRRSR